MKGVPPNALRAVKLYKYVIQKDNNTNAIYSLATLFEERSKGLDVNP